MNESESQGPLQGRPSSLKVKLLVELDEEGEDVNCKEKDFVRPPSENSWKEQFLRLVREAPKPLPVLCSEPRKFPHSGKRLSESSWTSATTRYTGVTLGSSTNSFDVTEDESTAIATLEKKRANSNSENLQDPLKASTTQGVSNDKRRESYVKSEKSEIFECENDQANKKKELLEEKAKRLSLSSTSQPLPLGNPDASKNVELNEEIHQVQGGVRKEDRNVCSSLGIYEDPEYWEKFRHSKDYQSSMVIEAICNEVFNLMPSSRYKSLMKLSQKRNLKKIERENKTEKERESESSKIFLTNNDCSSIAEQNNVEKVEAAGEKTKKDEICSIIQTLNEKLVEVNQNVNFQGDTITSKVGFRADNILLENDEKSISEEGEERRKKSQASTISSVCTTTTTEDFDLGREIFAEKIRKERLLIEKGFDQVFHGYLTKHETENLLKENGQYLIRQIWMEEGFILSFRLDEEIRNYRVTCSVTTTSPVSPERTSFPTSNPAGNNGLYTYYLEDRCKGYNTLDELVREGLVTLHLDENAGSYIDLLLELAQHQRNDNLLQTPPSVTPGSRKNSRSASFLRMKRLNSSSSTAGSPSIKSSSSIRRDSVQIALLIHFFEEEIFDSLARCQVCSHALWGSSNKGLKCRDCKFSVHESCIDNVKNECKPNLASISPFSVDLTTIVKGSLSTTEGSSQVHGPPYILERCVNEVEARGGLVTEGIYRISGSVEEIERLKNLFEKERINATLTECPDIHSITGLIKFFLRQLPESLITQEVFEEFIRDGTGELTPEVVQMLVSCLPPTHRITLKYLLDHLKRIASNRQENKMNAFNLSSVLMPSVMRPANMFDDFEASTKLLHFLIAYVDDIQF